MKITDQASQALKALITDNNVSSLRIFIDGIGWAGPQIGLALEEPHEEDTIKNINEIQVAFAKNSDALTENITLEYKYGRFLFLNPQNNC